MPVARKRRTARSRSVSDDGQRGGPHPPRPALQGGVASSQGDRPLRRDRRVALEHRREGIGPADDGPPDVAVCDLEGPYEHLQSPTLVILRVGDEGRTHEPLHDLVPADVWAGGRQQGPDAPGRLARLAERQLGLGPRRGHQVAQAGVAGANCEFVPARIRFQDLEGSPRPAQHVARPPPSARRAGSGGAVGPDSVEASATRHGRKQAGHTR